MTKIDHSEEDQDLDCGMKGDVEVSMSKVFFHTPVEDGEDDEFPAPPSATAAAAAAAATSSSATGEFGRKRLLSARSSATSDCEDEDIISIINHAPPSPIARPSPYTTASFLSRLTWNWLNEILALGSKKTLEEEDMYDILEEEKAGKRMEEIQQICEEVKQEQKSKQEAAAQANANVDGTPAPTKTSTHINLWKVLYKQLGVKFALVQSLLLFYTGFKLVQPLMLNQLVNFVSDPDEPAWHGFLYAIALGLGGIGQALVHHTYFFHAMRVGIDARIALNGIIYSKALKLRTTHMMKTTTGQVINLVSNDSAKVEDLTIYLPYLWSCPMECAIVLGLLYQQVGVAAFVGFAAVLCLTPMQIFFSRLFGKYRRYTVGRTDLRVKTINEILNGADVMKMMNWESSLEEKVNSIRYDEFKSISRAARLKSINQAAFFASTSVVNLVTFFTMYFRGVEFTPANVFTAISLFSIIRLPLTNFIPFAVEKLTEADIGLKRIATFLALDDAVEEEEGPFSAQLTSVKRKNDDLKQASQADPIKYPQGAIVMEGAAFVWDLKELNIPTVDKSMDSNNNIPSPSNGATSDSAIDSRQGLKDLNVRIQPGTLVGIIGSIGSYKSSFLAACLGEMTQNDGGVLINGSVAYASQTAWIFAGTIRENILFGRPFDAKRYLQTIRACQLVEDIKAAGDGDQTMIGERGASLSGGQRARVSLARAVYGEADVYLFDDPLAALDAVVARRLYDEVMGPRGILAHKSRILVTHQTHLLSQAHIILLDNGRIACQGSFDHLVASGYLKESQRHAQQDNDSAMEEAQKKLRKKAARERREKRKRDEQAALETKGKEASTANADVNKPKSGMMSAETSTVGSLELSVFTKLFAAGGGTLIALGVLLLVCAGQACSIAADKWLAEWSGKDPVSQKDDQYAWVYLALVGGTIVLGVIRARAFFVFILRAASNLHAAMFHAIIYSPMRFFESNPVGRILNRIAKDQSIVDEMLPLTFFDCVQCFIMVIGSLVVIGMSVPYVLLILVPIIPIFVWIRQHFLQTSRQLKRIDSVTRSPVYALFSSTLSGLMVIRSFKTEESFIQNFLHRMDDNSRVFVLFQMSQRWLGLRLDAIAAAVVLCLGLLIAGTRDTIPASDAGFALSYCLQLTALFQWAVRQSAEVETMLTSVERIVEYGELPPEGALVNPDYRPPAGWPTQGKIEFKDYKMRYRPGLDLVLKGVNVVIQPGEKCGVVGRTAAGKSSLFQSLLRLVEAADGSIEIDGLTIGKLGLNDLRSNLSIIAQYPVIFSASLRYNLDPFNRCADEQVWSALEAVQLKQMVMSLKDGLLTEMAEFGGNFSVGECQLLCVARALLKPSKILFVDEATANVDQKTDDLIQKVIREKFADRTVLTIAHRLNTILDSQKIIVMSAGRVAEVGSPAELLARPPADIIADPTATYGLFAFMAKQKSNAS